jgi:hypothetical protein
MVVISDSGQETMSVVVVIVVLLIKAVSGLTAAKDCMAPPFSIGVAERWYSNGAEGSFPRTPTTVVGNDRGGGRCGGHFFANVSSNTQRPSKAQIVT